MSAGVVLLVMFIIFIFAIGFMATYQPNPDRVNRKDRKNYDALIRLVNELDVQARAEQQVTNNTFAWTVSNEIAKSRRELTS